jgi:hypothetical protein
MKRLDLSRTRLTIFCLFAIFSVFSIRSAYAIVIPRAISPSQIASGAPGQTGVAVPINTTDATGIAKVSITLTFDASILAAKNVQLTPLTSGFTLGTPVIASGQVTISMSQSTGMPSGSGAILNVIFDVSPSAYGGAYATLTLQSVSMFDKNNQPIPFTKVPGLFTVTSDNPGISNLPPSPPLNVSPLDGVSILDLTPTLQASSFLDPNPGDTHSSSHWQVDNNPDFSSPAFDSGETITEKTSMTLPSGHLAPSTVYYWRVRYKDNQGAWSPWSSPTSFVTQMAYERWSGEVSFNLKFAVYVGDSAGNEKFGTETGPFSGTLSIYWVKEERNLAPNESGCYINFEGSSQYGPASFCITQKSSMLTYNVNAATSDAAYVKGIGTFTGMYDGENLEGLIFIDVTKATFKKDKTGALVSISFSSTLGGGTDDVTVFTGSLSGTLTKK